MSNKENIEYFNGILEKVNEKIRKRDDYVRGLNKKLLDILYDYLYSESGLEELSDISSNDFLFKSSESEFPPFFEWKQTLFEHVESIHPGTTYGAYCFNNPNFTFNPIALIISMKKCSSSECESALSSLKIKKTCELYDFEIFERKLLADATKNFDLKDLLDEFENSTEIDLYDVKDLGRMTLNNNIDPEGQSVSDVDDELMLLDDVEKIHLKILFGNDMFCPIYIGIGTNQPFGVRVPKGCRKSQNGEDRYYKFDLINRFEEIFYVKKGKMMNFDKNLSFVDAPLMFVDETVDGVTFALCENKMLMSEDFDWRSFNLGQPSQNDKDTWFEAVLDKRSMRLSLPEFSKGEELINEKLNIFPDYDKFRQVFFDPIRLVNAMGNDYAKRFLKKKGLLGAGTSKSTELSSQSLHNVASDLYNNGMFDGFRLRPSILFLKTIIKNGNFRENFKRLHEGQGFKPFKG